MALQLKMGLRESGSFYFIRRDVFGIRRNSHIKQLHDLYL